jgi:hypothetical protein
LSIDRVLTDLRLLAGALGDLSPWSLWLVVLKAADCLLRTPRSDVPQDRR